MKYIKENRKNLLSIKCDDILFTNNTFVEILELFKREGNGNFYIEGSRDTYEYDPYTIKYQIEKVLKNGEILEFSDFKIKIKGEDMNSELISILWKFWFTYEHVIVCFFIDDKNIVNLEKKAWYDITEYYKSFVLFKGIEENVVWIGKSDDLSFEFLI